MCLSFKYLGRHLDFVGTFLCTGHNF
jgi:hypothetical protein